MYISILSEVRLNPEYKLSDRQLKSSCRHSYGWRSGKRTRLLPIVGLVAICCLSLFVLYSLLRGSSSGSPVFFRVISVNGI